MKKPAKTKKKPKMITRKQSRYIITLALLFIIGAIAGLAISLRLRNRDQTVLVWRADKEVRVPDGLVSYLEKNHKNDCHDYKGTGSVAGVALFSVYETSQNRLAKMTYGCGNNLTYGNSGYIVAYKEDGKWNLTRPTHYFVPPKDAAKVVGQPAAFPECYFLSQHNIPASFESFCVNSAGNAVSR